VIGQYNWFYQFCTILFTVFGVIQCLTLKSWSVKLRDKRLKEFESRVLRKIFGLKRERVTRTGGDCIARRFMICTCHQIFG
jgi:hypothetical protein